MSGDTAVAALAFFASKEVVTAPPTAAYRQTFKVWDLHGVNALGVRRGRAIRVYLPGCDPELFSPSEDGAWEAISPKETEKEGWGF